MKTKKRQRIIHRGIPFNYCLRQDVLQRAKRELDCYSLEYFMLDRRENIIKVLFYCIQWSGKNISIDEFLNDYHQGLVTISRHDQFNVSQIHKSLKNAIKKYRIDW